MSFKARDRFLVILDVMGKWSLIDTYFMIMMICGFRFNTNVDLKIVKGSFNVTVTPLFDFYCFVLATMLSLVTTHVIIHHHRKSTEFDFSKGI